jgi:hypothetical protein
MAAPLGIAPKAWRYPIFFEDYSSDNFRVFKEALHAAWNPETRMCQYLLGMCQMPCAIRQYAISANYWLISAASSQDALSATDGDVPEIPWVQLETAESPTITPANPLNNIIEPAPVLPVVQAQADALRAKQGTERDKIRAQAELVAASKPRKKK